MIKGILFDKDGTLIDFTATFGPATAAVVRTLAKGDSKLAYSLAEAVDFHLDDQIFGETSIVIAGTVAQQAQVWGKMINRHDTAVLTNEIDILFARYATEFVTPFSYTSDVIDRLIASGLAIGLATNDSEIGARNQLEKMGFTSRFGFVAGYDSGHGPKPEPGMVSAFARHIGAQPHEVVMVGDSSHDMQSAKAAGSLAVAVTTGMATANALRLHADHVLNGIGELPDLITLLHAN